VLVVTLSKGRYREFSQGDTLVRIGSVLYDRIERRIAYLLDGGGQGSEAAPEPEISSRWFAVDPLTDSQESYSPYHYVYNNPVRLTDPDGRAPDDPPITGYKSALRAAVNHLEQAAGDSKLAQFAVGFLGTAVEAVPTLMFDPAAMMQDAQSAAGGVMNTVGEGMSALREGNGLGVANAALSLTDPVHGQAKGALATGAQALQGDMKAAGALVGTAAVAVVTHKIAGGGKTPAPSLETQAAKIKTDLNSGKNSVTIKTASGQVRYDLAGKPHGGVPTPHVQKYRNNVVGGVVKSVSRDGKKAVPMTQQDIRVVRKYLEKKT
jgi:hypothetical protein